MSLVKFELKEEHISLLRNMTWEKGELDPLVGVFDGDHYEEEMGIIIFGKPTEDYDVTDAKVIPYTEEQRETLKELAEGLPEAMDIIMYTGEFKAGYFKRKDHLRNWKRFEPKEKK